LLVDSNGKCLASRTIEKVEHYRLWVKTQYAISMTPVLTQELIKDNRFGEALAVVTSRKAANPEAEWVLLEESIKASAETSWGRLKGDIETAYRESRSRGIPQEKRDELQNDCRTKLDTVINNFGMPDIIQAAEDLKRDCGL